MFRRGWRAAAVAVLVFAMLRDGAAHEAAAPGYGPLPYAAPEPGSYALPLLGPAADGPVLTDGGAATRLHAAFGDRLVVLSFIYTHCEDANGCPLANHVLREAARRVAADPALAGAVRFVSLSFDPGRDTPAVLAPFAESLRPPGTEWTFYTGLDATTLAPLLAAYGQHLSTLSDGSIAHALRVYLVDRERRIRNIYSAAYLHADTLLADLRTLLTDAPEDSAPTGPGPALGAGDDKHGYAGPDYRTHSQAIASRRGAALDLLARLQVPQLGLPPLRAPLPGAAQIALGRRLFYDRRLSLNDTLSCAMCHVPEQGFTSNETSTPVGIEGRNVRRNAPTILNVGLLDRLFHDARERSLDQQIWGPLLATNEMGNPAIGVVLDKLSALPDYTAEFEAAFPGRGLGVETLGAALAAYERTLVAGGSAFDRWHYAHDAQAMSEAAQRGFALFTGKAGCAGCHTIGADSALFSDQALHNTGLGYARAMAEAPAEREVLLAPGTRLAVEAHTPPPDGNDLGRYEITQDPADRWRYRTPPLRNVALTAPYMHDGSLPDLDAVIAYYDAGGVPNEGLDARIRPLGLTAGERADLRAFLESLTGGDVEALVRDAFAAPIGDR
ncbi:MAG: SCO family protein [Gammaproteobacteria bacterium]|nr:SCO family protein [Gammaproteobacteria bacterium]MBI5617367.1 SCO family protein [Gammaproteobacteria bacterium]